MTIQFGMYLMKAKEEFINIIIKNLILPCRIGVHKHEKLGAQRVRISLKLRTKVNTKAILDKLDNVICYEKIIKNIEKITKSGHINLVETLADLLAKSCLEEENADLVKVKIEKLDVFNNVESVGVEIERKAH